MNIKDDFRSDKAFDMLIKYKSEICIKLNRIEKRIKIAIGGAVAGIVVIAAAVALTSASAVYTVAIDGSQAGYIDDPEMITEIVETTKAELMEASGASEIIFDSTKVTCTKAKADKKNVELLSDEELAEAISDPIYYSANAWAIKVDGVSIAAACSEEEANDIIEELKTAYQKEGTELISATFKEAVTVEQEEATLDLLMDAETAAQYILTGNKENKTYTVKDGDTLWDIAHESSMSTDELIAANPGFVPDKLKIGQILNMVEIKPYVNVITVEKVAESKKVDYKTVYENTNALYKGEVKVKSAGVYGEEKVVSEVVKENGVWVSTKVLSAEVVSEPVTQIALKGTKSLSTFVGSGQLATPLSGAISSGFGSRGGGRHTGIDIPASKGTAIKAADAGVVTYVGTYYAYGKLVKINHGKGVETWYAHCNGYNVSVGDIVEKGQVIAYVGNTGRTTGYHLHFEVRIGGTPVNPVNYL